MKKTEISCKNGMAILPGTLEQYYNVCGKPGCRCKDKENPKKHGPYYRLSYSIRGKNSCISVAAKDVPAVREMTENYRKARVDIQEQALDALEIYRQEGLSGVWNKFDQPMQMSASSGVKSDAVLLRETCSSRDKWKAKALERRELLDKARIESRDLKASRDKWKVKALTAQEKIEALQRDLATTAKRLAQAEIGDGIKKNATYQEKACD